MIIKSFADDPSYLHVLLWGSPADAEDDDVSLASEVADR